MKKIIVIFGTRPEAIKLAPVIKSLQKSKKISLKVCVTAQHREMLDQILKNFNIKPDYDLDLMKKKQNLEDLTSLVMKSLKKIFLKEKPDLVIVHGDTTTTLAASLASYYMQIDVAHIEAGLRTNNIYSPWPEEVNRKIVGVIAKYHFAPTKSAVSNLLKENIVKKNIYKTGNTVIDSLKLAYKIIRDKKGFIKSFNKKFSFIDHEKKLILVTGHRRENFGDNFKRVCEALKKISYRKDVQIVYPVHRNPKVINPAEKLLKSCKNIFLIDPLEYLEFMHIMSKSYFIITDSGGIQEEAPALGKPVLVTRKTTERPEAINEGTAKLVGTSLDKIVSESVILLENKKAYNCMNKKKNLFGDGKASERIVKIIERNV